MASLAHTYTFSANAVSPSMGSEVNINFEDTKVYINDRNSGAAAWEEVDITSTSATPHTITSSAVTTTVVIDNTRADGDPVLTWQLSGTSQFTMGVDDGDDDKFKIGTTAVGTGTWFTWDGSGLVLSLSATLLSFDGSAVIDTSGNNALIFNAGNASIDMTTSGISFAGAATIDTSGNNALTLNCGTDGLNITATVVDHKSSEPTTEHKIDNTATDGDPILTFQLSGTTNFALGVDDGDGDDFKIGTTTIGTSTMFQADSTGAIRKPLQPSFLAQAPSSPNNQTGDGTAETVEFDSEIYDLNSDFDTGSFTFTAPVTGKYIFCSHVTVAGISTGHTSTGLRIITSNRIYLRYDLNQSVSNKVVSVAVVADMDASDTAVVTITSSGGSKTAETDDDAETNAFSGSLLN